MRNRKNRIQRQEVRRILENIRKELQDYRLHYEDLADNARPMLHLKEVMPRSRRFKFKQSDL